MLPALLAAGLLTGLSAAATVPLEVRDPGGTALASWPITMGVPFPRGLLTGEPSVRLSGAQGAVPVQAAVTGRHPDGSVRWLRLDFLADLPAGGGRYSLETGVAGPPPAQAIRLTESAAAFELDTGPLQVRIRRERGSFLDQVTCNGRVLLPSDPLAGPYFVDETGKVFRTALDPTPEIAIESSGPLHTVITARSWYTADDGARKCRSILRLHAYAGQPYLRLFQTWIMTESSGALRFRDIGCRFPSNLTQASFGVQGRPAVEAPANAQPYLLQHDADQLTVAGQQAERSAGWVEGRGPEGTVALAVRDLWQNFPKELGAGPDGLTFHLWPAHGVSRPDRKVEDSMLQSLWFCHEGELLDFTVPASYHTHQGEHTENDYRYLRSAARANAMGIAKTQELLLGFNTAAAPLAAALQEPPAALADPGWMCESGVFGRIHPADPARFAADEQLLSGNFDAEQRMQAATRDYGMWNYGDGHTIWDLGRGRWHDVYRTWRNTHHGAPRVPWLLYVRSGDPKYLAAAIRNTRHVLDIDFCHFSTPETEKLEYPNGKLKGALNDYKGIVHWHSGNRLTDYNSMTDFALWYWQLTGDRWGLEVAQEWGEAVKAKYTGPFGHREGAGTCSALIDLYLETGDPEYRRMVEEFIERFITREQSDGTRPYPTEMVQKYPGLADQPAPAGSFPQWENYAPWLERYIDLTDDPRAKQALVRWADAYLAGYGDSCSYWSIGDYTNILGYAYFLTGDVKYLKRGRWELDRARQSVYRGENPLPQGLIQLGQTSLAGYIVQRAPILMAALAKHGKPVAPEALYRPASGFRLPIRRTRPVIDGQPKKVEEVEAWLLEATDAPLTITCQVSHNYEQWKVTARLLGPDGQPVAELTDSWPKGSKSIELSAPADGKTGIYRLTVTGEGSYWGVAQPIRTAPALPTAFPLKERFVTLSGAEYHVYLPASAREATARLTAQAGTELAAQWKGPEGTWQPCSTTSDGQPFTTPALAVPAAGRGQVWSLILNGGSAAMEVLVDGQPQPLVFQAAYPAAICEALLAAK